MQNGRYEFNSELWESSMWNCCYTSQRGPRQPSCDRLLVLITAIFIYCKTRIFVIRSTTTASSILDTKKEQELAAYSESSAEWPGFVVCCSGRSQSCSVLPKWPDRYVLITRWPYWLLPQMSSDCWLTVLTLNFVFNFEFPRCITCPIFVHKYKTSLLSSFRETVFKMVRTVL